ncbi:MAG: trimeric intracellular cation channel family protein [Gammaproteobacteria bacterium]
MMPAFDLTIAVLDWLGVIVFAATGALVASRKSMDIVGFVLLGTVTGIGGGTIRDVLLGSYPILWVGQPGYLAACAAVSVVVFFTAHLLHSRYRLLLWFDAMGLAIFAVAGAEKGLLLGASPLVAVTVGVISATFGGIIRDVLGDEPSVILRPEVYVTAALVAAMVFIAASLLAVPRDIAVVIGVLAGLLVRGGALLRGWTLPRYRARPGRNED